MIKFLQKNHIYVILLLFFLMKAGESVYGANIFSVEDFFEWIILYAGLFYAKWFYKVKETEIAKKKVKTKIRSHLDLLEVSCAGLSFFIIIQWGFDTLMPDFLKLIIFSSFFNLVLIQEIIVFFQLMPFQNSKTNKLTTENSKQYPTSKTKTQKKKEKNSSKDGDKSIQKRIIKKRQSTFKKEKGSKEKKEEDKLSRGDDDATLQ